MNNIANAQKARREKHLSQLTRVDGQTMSKGNMIQYLLDQGYKLNSGKVDRIKDMSALRYFRASAKEQQEHERKQREAGKKTVYSLEKPLDNHTRDVYPITKIQYDLAIALVANTSYML
jgi:hypothetical protein